MESALDRALKTNYRHAVEVTYDKETKQFIAVFKDLETDEHRADGIGACSQEAMNNLKYELAMKEELARISRRRVAAEKSKLQYL